MHTLFLWLTLTCGKSACSDHEIRTEAVTAVFLMDICSGGNKLRTYKMGANIPIPIFLKFLQIILLEI